MASPYECVRLSFLVHAELLSQLLRDTVYTTEARVQHRNLCFSRQRILVPSVIVICLFFTSLPFELYIHLKYKASCDDSLVVQNTRVRSYSVLTLAAPSLLCSLTLIHKANWSVHAPLFFALCMLLSYPSFSAAWFLLLCIHFFLLPCASCSIHGMRRKLKASLGSPLHPPSASRLTRFSTPWADHRRTLAQNLQFSSRQTR